MIRFLASKWWALCIGFGGLLFQALPANAGISLELRSSTEQCLVDEFLYVTLILRNAGTQNAPFLRLLDPAMGIVSLEVTTPDGQAHTYRPLLQASLDSGAFEQSVAWLGPGEEFSSSMDVSYEPTVLPGEDRVRPSMLLSKPGTYCLRACYTVPEGAPTPPVAVWSNEIRISVADPAGDDLAAYQIIQAGPRTQQDGLWNAYREQAACYEQVIRDYPTSVYAAYARWSLGSIRGLEGMHFLRGKPEAPGLIQESADLFLSVARDAGQSPLGLHATEAAVKALAALGRTPEAQTLLEDAFVWPVTTDRDRSSLLGLMDHLQTGHFRRSWGLAKDAAGTELSVPLRSFAKALRFSVDWAPESRSVTVSAPRVSASLRLSDATMTVNGKKRLGVRAALKDGRMEVSPSVVATLVAEKYDKGMASEFPNLIAQTERSTSP